MLRRDPIPEPGRYYHQWRTIVLRAGLLLVEERRHLWHELVHADRHDEHCHADDKMEASVEREAAARAMPLGSLEWAFGTAVDFHGAADLLKLPSSWVEYRLRTMHPAGLALVRAAAASRQEIGGV